MTIMLRPVADTVRTNIAAGTFADIDEVTASDSDFVRTTAGVNATYEVKLSPARGKKVDDIGFVSFRAAKCDSVGALASDGKTITITYAIYQGGTLIYSSPSTSTLGGSYTAPSGSVILTSVTDWSDVRIRFTITSSGTGTNRGALISYAALEAPFNANNGLMAFF